jgi:uncharacterized protein
MLWRVSGTSFFILGSIHVSNRPLVLPAAATQAVEAAQTLAFEANFDIVPKLGFARYAGTESLSRNISPALFLDAKRLWLELELPEEELETNRPWWAAFRLMFTAMSRRGFLIEQGIDRKLLNLAKTDQKSTFFLENISAGLMPFSKAPVEEQAVFLSRVAQHSEEGLREVATMVTAWESGNPQNFLPIVERYLSLMPVSYAGALGGRNRAWIPQLLRLLRSGRKVVVVVGALHMIGPQNIPSLLAAKGFDCSLVPHP